MAPATALPVEVRRSVKLAGLEGEKRSDDSTIHVLAISMLGRTEQHLETDRGRPAVRPTKHERLSLHMLAHGLTLDAPFARGAPLAELPLPRALRPDGPPRIMAGWRRRSGSLS